MALVQCAWSAASTAGVFLGHGPSSKVRTTSPSRRKSWLLKCSKPKPGPPVVSISTTRATPSALGLLQELDMAEGSGGAAAAVGEAAGEAWANAAGDWAAAAGAVASLSMLVTTGPGARPSVGAAAWAGVGAGSRLFCQKIAPNTATHSRIASVDAIAARRMSDLQTGAPKPNLCPWTEVSAPTLNPSLSGQFEAKSTKLRDYSERSDPPIAAQRPIIGGGQGGCVPRVRISTGSASRIPPRAATAARPRRQKQSRLTCRGARANSGGS